jgi:hypothetical protein
MSNLPLNAKNAALGATVVQRRVVFRTWAPRATQVSVIGDFSGWQPSKAGLLQSVGDGTWAGVIPGLDLDTPYDNWVNPWVAGNGGQIWAGGPALHSMPASASVVIPANGFCVFAQG